MFGPSSAMYYLLAYQKQLLLYRNDQQGEPNERHKQNRKKNQFVLNDTFEEVHGLKKYQ